MFWIRRYWNSKKQNSSLWEIMMSQPWLRNSRSLNHSKFFAFVQNLIMIPIQQKHILTQAVLLYIIRNLQRYSKTYNLIMKVIWLHNVFFYIKFQIHVQCCISANFIHNALLMLREHSASMMELISESEIKRSIKFEDLINVIQSEDIQQVTCMLKFLDILHCFLILLIVYQSWFYLKC